MRASFADLTLCDVKLSEPSDKAAASVLDVDADVEGRSGTIGEAGTTTGATDDTLWEEPWRGAFCRRNCKALARAFSWVRTKVASCCARRDQPELGGRGGGGVRGVGESGQAYFYEELAVFRVHFYR